MRLRDGGAAEVLAADVFVVTTALFDAVSIAAARMIVAFLISCCWEGGDEDDFRSSLRCIAADGRRFVGYAGVAEGGRMGTGHAIEFVDSGMESLRMAAAAEEVASFFLISIFG